MSAASRHIGPLKSDAGARTAGLKPNMRGCTGVQTGALDARFAVMVRCS